MHSPLTPLAYSLKANNEDNYLRFWQYPGYTELMNSSEISKAWGSTKTGKNNLVVSCFFKVNNEMFELLVQQNLRCTGGQRFTTPVLLPSPEYAPVFSLLEIYLRTKKEKNILVLLFYSPPPVISEYTPVFRLLKIYWSVCWSGGLRFTTPDLLLLPSPQCWYLNTPLYSVCLRSTGACAGGRRYNTSVLPPLPNLNIKDTFVFSLLEVYWSVCWRFTTPALLLCVLVFTLADYHPARLNIRFCEIQKDIRYCGYAFLR